MNFSQQSPKMFKIASDIFIHAFLLFLGLFFKIFRWVPLKQKQKEKTQTPPKKLNKTVTMLLAIGSY